MVVLYPVFSFSSVMLSHCQVLAMPSMLRTMSVMMVDFSVGLILRTSLLFADSIIPDFSPYDRDQITMPKPSVIL